MSHEHETHEADYGTHPKTLKAYVIGFILCVILTLVPFGMVAQHMVNDFALYIAITVLAVLQLIVQVVFFLRLNVSPSGKWNVMSFLFAILVTLVIVLGSWWIMYNLNYNMMH